MDIERLITDLTQLRAHAEMAHYTAQRVLAETRTLQDIHADLCAESQVQREYLRQEINRPRVLMPTTAAANR